MARQPKGPGRGKGGSGKSKRRPGKSQKSAAAMTPEATTGKTAAGAAKAAKSTKARTPQAPAPAISRARPIARTTARGRLASAAARLVKGAARLVRPAARAAKPPALPAHAPSGVYQFLAQERVIYGRPAAEAVAEEATRRGASRVFIVASKTLSRETEVIKAIRAALGNRFAGLFDETVAHVPRETVIAAAEAVRAAKPDLIVTVGGGTPIDTVKVMLVCLAENITDSEKLGEYYVRVKPDGSREAKPVAAPPMRQIIVPTTLSGAEFSNLGGATDPQRQVKDLYTAREIGGDAVILDAAATVHTPAWLWLSTGLRAVDHAVETICSKAPQPFTDATAIHGLRMLAQSLRRNHAAPDDLDARLDSQLGVWLSSTGLGRVPWGASHGIGHQLGAVANVPHGYCSCVMLPSVLRWNKAVNGAQQAHVAEAVGRKGMEAADAVAELVAELGLPSRLSDVGVKREHFDAIAAGALTNLFVNQNPRRVATREDVVEMLDMAY